MASLLMCPHCGWQYDPATEKDRRDATSPSPFELVPTHDWPPPFRAVCPGTHQHPRNPDSDRRPLRKDLSEETAENCRRVDELVREATANARTCEKCGSPMAHYRLHGYRCPHGC
jgi:rubredoxin